MITETIGRLKMNYRAETILSDLDRCPHGRHEGDACSGWRGPGMFDGGCQGGVSLGNPLLRPGTIVGTSIHGAFAIRMPSDRNDRHDPKAWYVPMDQFQGLHEQAVVDALIGGA